MNKDQQPATKADLTPLRADLTKLEARLIERLNHIETSLLTAFHNYTEGVNLPPSVRQ